MYTLSIKDAESKPLPSMPFSSSFNHQKRFSYRAQVSIERNLEHPTQTSEEGKGWERGGHEVGKVEIKPQFLWDLLLNYLFCVRLSGVSINKKKLQTRWNNKLNKKLLIGVYPEITSRRFWNLKLLPSMQLFFPQVKFQKFVTWHNFWTSLLCISNFP